MNRNIQLIETKKNGISQGCHDALTVFAKALVFLIRCVECFITFMCVIFYLYIYIYLIVICIECFKLMCVVCADFALCVLQALGAVTLILLQC